MCPDCEILLPVLKRANPRILPKNQRISCDEWNRLAALPALQRTPEEDQQMVDLLLVLSRSEWRFPALVYTESADSAIDSAVRLRFEEEQWVWKELGEVASRVLPEDEFEPVAEERWQSDFPHLKLACV
jgi:hypothetical protein